jgi:hypothetical protein
MVWEKFESERPHKALLSRPLIFPRLVYEKAMAELVSAESSQTYLLFPG